MRNASSRMSPTPSGRSVTTSDMLSLLQLTMPTAALGDGRPGDDPAGRLGLGRRDFGPVLEQVAGPALAVKVAGMRRVRLDLAPQAADLDAHDLGRLARQIDRQVQPPRQPLGR